MSDHTEAGRPDDRTAEQLLDGADGHARLHALLAAAAAPGRPAELAGEDAAAAAFLAAPRPGRRAWRAALRRFLTAKVIALVGGGSILVSGGVAYATGHLPGQSPAQAPSPSHRQHESSNSDSTPATHSSPDAVAPTGPAPSSARKQHGKAVAPGRQKKKTPNPNATKPRPRGSETSNGSPPGSNSGNGIGTGKDRPPGGGAQNGETENGQTENGTKGDNGTEQGANTFTTKAGTGKNKP